MFGNQPPTHIWENFPPKKNVFFYAFPYISAFLLAFKDWLFLLFYSFFLPVTLVTKKHTPTFRTQSQKLVGLDIRRPPHMVRENEFTNTTPFSE